MHPASIEAANRHAQEQQITNVRFSIATAKDFPGNDYGFVTVFDAPHDMGDPVGAALHVKQSLQPDGTFMIVEPLARDSLAENINTSASWVGRSRTILARYRLNSPETSKRLWMARKFNRVNFVIREQRSKRRES